LPTMEIKGIIRAPRPVTLAKGCPFARVKDHMCSLGFGV
jgi:hypothetical protein